MADKYSNQILHELLIEIKQECKKTNGRLRALEVWRGFITGGLAVIGAVLIPIIIKTFF